jgi:CheY-like chemotaxis protein
MVEESKRQCGFLALRPGEIIPAEVSFGGFRFGHSLFGNANFEIVHFAFEFYGFKIYNALVNPNNRIVQAVVAAMIESRDYFFFALDPRGRATAFRSELGQPDLVGLDSHLPRIRGSTTTDAQYRKGISSFAKNPEPPGILLNWVCQDRVEYLDLVEDRLDLTPEPTM